MSTLRLLEPAVLRPEAPTPDGNMLADYLGQVDDPGQLAARLSQTPGVIEHGLFPPELTSEIVVASGAEICRFRPAA
jgi:ribose 5-phosphate isomerase A